MARTNVCLPIQSVAVGKMAGLTFETELCKGCSLCVNACPKKILTLCGHVNAKGYHTVECKDMSQCIGCAFCYTMCPDCVITVVKE